MRLLLSAVAVVAMTVFASGIAQAETLSIDLVADGKAENPPSTAPGSVLARFTYNTDTHQLTYALTVNGISSTLVTAAHIHRGGVGTNGPVVYPLSTVPFGQVSGSITLTAADVADLKAGNFYLNAHSTEAPGGFARAQIVFPGLASTGGGTVTPPSTGDAGLAGQSGSSAWLLVLLAPALLAGATGLRLLRRSA